MTAIARPADEAAIADPSGWYAVQLRYSYLIGDPPISRMVEDRVILVDGTDEEAALGRACEIAPEYEDELHTEDGDPGRIRFDGIVAIKELNDPPAAGIEVWHELMAPSSQQEDGEGEPLPPVYPVEMAFPRASDD
jgi:hypothetical protein